MCIIARAAAGTRGEEAVRRALHGGGKQPGAPRSSGHRCLTWLQVALYRHLLLESSSFTIYRPLGASRTLIAQPVASKPATVCEARCLTVMILP